MDEQDNVGGVAAVKKDKQVKKKTNSGHTKKENQAQQRATQKTTIISNDTKLTANETKTKTETDTNRRQQQRTLVDGRKPMQRPATKRIKMKMMTTASPIGPCVVETLRAIYDASNTGMTEDLKTVSAQPPDQTETSANETDAETAMTARSGGKDTTKDTMNAESMKETKKVRSL
jgi:hypothetical protein